MDWPALSFPCFDDGEMKNSTSVVVGSAGISNDGADEWMVRREAFCWWNAGGKSDRWNKKIAHLAEPVYMNCLRLLWIAWMADALQYKV